MNIDSLVRILAPFMWLISAVLFVLSPESGMLFSLGVRILLENVRVQVAPIFQVGDIAVLYSDGFFAVFVLFFCFTQAKLLLTTYSRYKVRITPLILLFSWIGLQTMRGMVLNGASSIRQATLYFFPILYCFVLPTILREKAQVKRFTVRLFAIIVGVVVLNLVHYYLLGGMESALSIVSGWRVRFRFLSSLQVMLAGVGFNAFLVFVLASKGKLKLQFYALLAVLALAVFLPQFRSIWLAVAVGTLMIVLRVKDLPRLWIYAALSFLLLLGTIPLFSLLAGQQFNEVLAESTGTILEEGFQEDDTWQFRLRVWQESWTAIRENLLLGRGLGEHVYIIRGGEERATIMHNDYLAYISNFGLVGLCLFGVFVRHWLVSLRHYTRLESERFYKYLGIILRVSVFMYVIFAVFFSFGEWFWVFIGIGSTLVDIKKHEVVET